eukprot:TRINITY_DN2516_c0_g1_i1.p1 TRINITY_DN2516_c0_g1~~TRINITY_DN2516_c0_g1_i1.p1  ORF type:complete len:217 (+),score=13.42 TRINITY_DN2516_c0_g1_i1:274-924(+)
MIQPLTATTPFHAAVGNHDVREALNSNGHFAISDRFYFPSTQTARFYSFDYGLAHILILDTESSLLPQRNWIDNDLRKVDRNITPWVLAVFHRPIYSTNERHQGETTSFRKTFEPFFRKYHVDIAFSGHVHAYERSFRTSSYHRDENGTVYITIGNGGSREGLDKNWIPDRSYSAVRYSQDYGHGKLHIFNHTHALWVMKANTKDYEDRTFLERYA